MDGSGRPAEKCHRHLRTKSGSGNCLGAPGDGSGKERRPPRRHRILAQRAASATGSHRSQSRLGTLEKQFVNEMATQPQPNCDTTRSNQLGSATAEHQPTKGKMKTTNNRLKTTFSGLAALLLGST